MFFCLTFYNVKASHVPIFCAFIVRNFSSHDNFPKVVLDCINLIKSTVFSVKFKLL
jgi:hypothetical protein